MINKDKVEPKILFKSPTTIVCAATDVHGITHGVAFHPQYYTEKRKRTFQASNSLPLCDNVFDEQSKWSNGPINCVACLADLGEFLAT